MYKSDYERQENVYNFDVYKDAVLNTGLEIMPLPSDLPKPGDLKIFNPFGRDTLKF